MKLFHRVFHGEKPWFCSSTWRRRSPPRRWRCLGFVPPKTWRILRPGFNDFYLSIDFGLNGRVETFGLPGHRETGEAQPHAHIRWFAYVDRETGGRVLSGDHTCFMNHAPDPNTGAPSDSTPPNVIVALRDIAAGEELTCDYWAFDAEAREKLG